jgi:hypothetical protein
MAANAVGFLDATTMNEPTPHARQMSPRSARRDAAIDDLLQEHAPSSNQDLLAQMMVSVCRLAKDGAGRGELKILNMALKELRYAFKVFAPYSDIPKVTIFGSSRTPEDHPAYVQAHAFAERIEQEGWMVITGAGDGIMRAGHHGAKRESSFGVAISLPFEQRTNEIIADDPKCVNFKYFFTRKLLFVKEASAIALFPGGFGTQDENFEALTLIQTGKANPMPVVLCDAPGGSYWTHWRQYVGSELLDKGMISQEDLCLFKITDDVEEAVREILHFYRRYHSSRMVRDNLVIRLRTPLDKQAVAKLNDDFGDILVGGRIHVLRGPLAEEGDEFPELHRLVLRFDRRSYGRLRRLIDAVNDA